MPPTNIPPPPGNPTPTETHSEREIQISVPGGAIVREVRADYFGDVEGVSQADFTLNDVTIRGKKVSADISEFIVDAQLDRTIEGASTIELTIADYDRKILNSSLTTEKSVLEIQGMKFVLVKVKKTGERLSLTFEDWAVWKLRQRTGIKKATRKTDTNHGVTRAQFAESLVKEIHGLKFYSPEKDKVQDTYPIDTHNVDPDTAGTAPSGPSGTVGPGAGAGTYQNWAKQFLDMLHYGDTQDNLDAICAWILAEIGGTGQRSQFNPLNTKQSAPGATNFNSVGVKNYPNWDTGVRANYETLTNGHPTYAPILAALSAGNNAATTCAAIDASAWGTGGGVGASGTLPQVVANRTLNYNQVIPGARENPPRNTTPAANTSQTAANREGQQEGFDRGTTFQIKGDAATIQQIRITERVLRQGRHMNVNAWILAAGLTAMFADSEAHNWDIAHSPTFEEDVMLRQTRFGIFQFPVSRFPNIQNWTIEQQAQAFYRAAKYQHDMWKLNHPSNPVLPLHQLANFVTQRDTEGDDWREQGDRYRETGAEALTCTELFLRERIGYGGAPFQGTDQEFGQDDYNFVTNSGPRPVVVVEPYEFTRGTPEQPENSWECLQRLADEVNWRCFCVGNTIYFCRDKVLLKNKALDKIDEFSDGVDFIDFDFDVGKPVSMIRVRCRATRWKVIPGSTVIINKLGPATGRYIVSDFRRSMFSPKAEITLIGAQPQLKEPAPDTHIESIDPDGPGGDSWGTEAGVGASAGTTWNASLMDGANRVVRWAISKKRGPGPNSYRLYPSTHRTYQQYVQNPGYDGPWDCSSFCSDAWAKVEVDIAGTTGTMWQKCIAKGLPRGGGSVNGIRRPPDGWKPGDLIWPRNPMGVGGDSHVMMATGNGDETVEAAGSRIGIRLSQRGDQGEYWARPAGLIPEKYRGNDPNDVDPRVRFD